jgi:hypothetical protein
MFHCRQDVFYCCNRILVLWKEYIIGNIYSRICWCVDMKRN